MEANYYAGIDISKQRLDWQINDGQNQLLAIGDIGNSPDGIRELLEKWSHQGISLEKWLCVSSIRARMGCYWRRCWKRRVFGM